MAPRQSNQIHSYIDYLYELDYRERPVSVEQFICDKHYLGKTTGEGKMIYPTWIEESSIYLNDLSKFLVVVTGAIGIGKTYICIASMLYGMHRILCLKNPWEYFGLAKGARMAMAFFNLTKTLSDSKGFSLAQSFLIESDWFRDRSSRIAGTKAPVVEFPLFRYVLASPYSKGYGTQGENVILALMDEVDSDIEPKNQKIRVLKAYNSTVQRFKSRFVDPSTKKTLGKFYLAASKQEEASFLDTFIAEMKDSGSVHIVDKSIWEVKPSTDYSGEMFSIYVGDVFSTPKILRTQEEISQVPSDELGKIIEVPIEYLDDFERDMIGSLRDIAGISVAGIRKYKLFPSEKFVYACFRKEIQNPLGDTYTIHTGLEDPISYIQYFDFTKFRYNRSIPRFIHCDIAFSGDGDSLGLGMSLISGWSEVNFENDDGIIEKRKVPLVETEFAIRFKARPGDQVPTHKVRKLVLDLKAVGFNIKKFTSDLKLAANDSFQILGKAKIDTDYLSLDRKIDNYINFRNLAFEGRWTTYYHPILACELINLEHDKDKGKIDHPDKVQDLMIFDDGTTQETIIAGSKDVSDGVVGSVTSALMSAKVPADKVQIGKLMNRVASSSNNNRVDNIRQLLGVEQVNLHPKTEVPSISVDNGTKRAFADLLKRVK